MRTATDHDPPAPRLVAVFSLGTRALVELASARSTCAARFGPGAPATPAPVVDPGKAGVGVVDSVSVTSAAAWQAP